MTPNIRVRNQMIADDCKWEDTGISVVDNQFGLDWAGPDNTLTHDNVFCVPVVCLDVIGNAITRHPVYVSNMSPVNPTAISESA